MMRFGADQPELHKRFTVQDLTPPRALVDAFRHGYGVVAELTQADVHADSLARMVDDLDGWNTTGAMNHSLGFLIMAHDSSDGRIILDDDGHPKIHWPAAPSEAIYGEVNAILRAAVQAIGGRYLPDPRWSSHLLGNNLVTAHPLGGCATADSALEGVVDHAGRVFAPGGGVYDGLRVCDGSVIPRALAVNPLLTISMFAERAADSLRSELGLPAYDDGVEGDDRGPGYAGVRAKAEAAARTAADRAGRAPARANGTPGTVRQRITALRSLAAVDRARAQDDLWEWLQELGDSRDATTLAALFELGGPPSQLDGSADGILVTTLINPLVDVPLRLLSKVWSPWRGTTFDAASGTEVQRLWMVTRLAMKCVPRRLGRVEDDLVELAPDTHLGRILVRALGAGPARIGYIALRYPAAT
jgi:cholesterol oxidase